MEFLVPSYANAVGCAFLTVVLSISVVWELRFHSLTNESGRPSLPGNSTESRMARSRRLAIFAEVVNYQTATQSTGCVTVSLTAADVELDLKSMSCGGHSCPTCFWVTEASASYKLVLRECSSLRRGSYEMGSSSTYPELQSFLASISITNADATNALTISDGTQESTLVASSSAVAWCYSGGGNTMFFQHSAAAAAGAAAETGLVFSSMPVITSFTGTPCVGRAEGAAADLPLGDTPYTIEAQVKPDAGSITTNVVIVSYGTAAANKANGFSFNNGPNSLKVWWWGSDIKPNIGAALDDGAFHHVASTWDGTTRKVWVDGVQKFSKAATGLATEDKSKFCIGQNFANGGGIFEGEMKEIKIWSVAKEFAP